MAMDDPKAVPIKIPDWSGLVKERNRLAAELDAARARIAELEAEMERLRVHQVIRAGGAEPITDADLETSDVAPPRKTLKHPPTR